MMRTFQILILALLSGICLGNAGVKGYSQQGYRKPSFGGKGQSPSGSGSKIERDPCPASEHKVLNQTTRSTGYDLRGNEKPTCDNFKRGWYRFVDLEGKPIPMATSCPGYNTCGTRTGVWMKGTLPSIGETLTVYMCGQLQNKPGANCCEFKDDIHVKNCGAYYVYKIYRLDCDAAYCAGNRKRCPIGKWSTTKYEPCKDVSITITRPTITGPHIQSGGTFYFRFEITNRADPDIIYEITWTINGKPDSSIPTTTVSGTQREVTLSGDKLRGRTDITIGVVIIVYYRGQEGSKKRVEGIPVYFGVQSTVITGPILTNSNQFQYSCDIIAPTTGPNQSIEVIWTFNDAQDPKIRPQFLSGSTRIAILDGALLRGHINTNVSVTVVNLCQSVRCQARLTYGNNNVKTNFIQTSTIFIGFRFNVPRLEINVSEGEKTVTLISTVPITCSGGGACCLTFDIINSKSSVVTIKGSCRLQICNTNWDSARKQASITFTVVANKNYISSGNSTADLSFGEFGISGTGLIEIFRGVRLNSLSVLVRLQAGGRCAITGDPHFEGFDNKTPFHIYQVGDYTAVQMKHRTFTIQIRTWKCAAVSCVCGVAIREGNDIIRISGCDKPTNFLSATLQAAYPLSQGTLVKRSSNGGRIGVRLPSGTEIKIDLIQSAYVYMDIYIHLPASDRGQALGVCGTNDGNGANDFTHPNLKITPRCAKSCIPVEFTESWRVTGAASLFQVAPQQVQVPSPVQYCKCSPGIKGASACSPTNEIPDNPILCTNCEDITTVVIIKYWSETTVYNPGQIPQQNPEKTWPNDNGVTLDQATVICRTAIQSSVLYAVCEKAYHVAALVMDECLGDILYGGITNNLDAVISSFTRKCQIISQEDPTYQEAGDSILQSFLELKCPVANNCKPHGSCSPTGKCECDKGWQGPSCETKTVTVITITYTDSGPGCGSTPCNSVEFVRSDVTISGDLICRLQLIDAQGRKTGQPIYTKAIRVTSNRVTCPLLDKGPIYTYLISVSQSQDNFGNALVAFKLDRTCLVCSRNQCSIKTSVCIINSVCYQQGSVNRSNSRQFCDVNLNPNGWTEKKSRCKNGGGSSTKGGSTKGGSTKGGGYVKISYVKGGFIKG